MLAGYGLMILSIRRVTPKAMDTVDVHVCVTQPATAADLAVDVCGLAWQLVFICYGNTD